MPMPGASLATDLKTIVLFSTLLPLVQRAPVEGRDIARASWAFPVIGALLGGAAALVYWAATRAGLPPGPAAALALATTLAATGCLHEDGLADTADGFGAGGAADRARKLAIMRDAAIGTYGACALAISLLLRWSALAAMAEPGAVAMALVAAHAGARGALPAFMRFVPPARQDGLAADAGRPPPRCAAAAALLGVGLVGFTLGLVPATTAIVLLAAASLVIARLALNQIGGHTGDVLGAQEQVGEAVILLAAAAFAKA